MKALWLAQSQDTRSRQLPNIIGQGCVKGVWKAFIIVLKLQAQAPLHLIALFLFCGLLSACGKEKTGDAAKTEKVQASVTAPAVKPALTVSLIEPVRKAMPKTVRANGNIVPWQEASVGAEMTARVESLSVQVGDKVRRYQELARFASQVSRADHGQLVAVVKEAEAAYAEAKSAALRARALEEDGFMGKQMSSQYQTAEATAKAKVEQAKAARDASELRLQNSVVRATDDGVISRVNVVVGSLTPAGSEMFRLIRNGRLEWRAEVTATELAFIKPGMNAEVDLGNEQRVQGQVRMLSPTVDLQTRKAIVYIDLPSSPHARAGMYASGTITTGETTAVMLPQGALVLRDGFSYVMRVDAQNRAHQVGVQVGRQQEGMVEILSGLSDTDKVVASGAAFVADGDTVRVVAAPAAAAQSPDSRPASATTQ